MLEYCWFLVCLFQLYRYTIQLWVGIHLFSLCLLSRMGDYDVFINCLMLFSSYFLIMYLMYITVTIINSKLLISPTCFWSLGSLQRARDTPGPLWRNTPCTCSQFPQPQDTPALVPKPIRLQGCDTSPGHLWPQGNRISISLPYFSVFTLWFELEYIGELQSCGFFFSFSI